MSTVLLRKILTHISRGNYSMFYIRGWNLKSSNQPPLFPHILPILLLTILKMYYANWLCADATKHTA